MPNTYKLIASSTVGSGGAASIDFTSIDSTYTDLLIKISARITGTAGVKDLGFQFNGDTAANYFYAELGGNGTAGFAGTGSGSRHNTIAPPNSSTSNTFNNVEVYIPNYRSSAQKSTSADAIVEQNSASTDTQLRIQAWKWSGTGAITSIKIFPPGETIMQYSTAYLYGINNA